MSMPPPEPDPGITQSAGALLACGNSSIRVALHEITVVDEVDDTANDIVYCLIHAESAAGSEVRLTPATRNLAAGESHALSLEDGLIWGSDGVRDPEGNLKVTYNCFEQDDVANYMAFLGKLEEGLGAAAVASKNVWVAAAGAASGVINAALALNSDDYIFNATQTIDARQYLNAAAGSSWIVARGGSDNLGFGSWEWDLSMVLWGCAEFGGTGSGCDSTSCYSEADCSEGSCDLEQSCCTL